MFSRKREKVLFLTFHSVAQRRLLIMKKELAILWLDGYMLSMIVNQWYAVCGDHEG